ncbi:MAG: sigma factor-like helix-turn-helix DNA-binding protein [Candidatus Paceibacterota bacterium]
MLSLTINNLIRDLKPRQKEILAGRFGLAGGGKETLAGIGGRYNITRERVRQLEESALDYVRENLEKEKSVKGFREAIINHLDEFGGLRKDDLFVSEIKSALNDKKLHHWHLRFFSEISGDFFYKPADKDFHGFWYFDEKHIDKADSFFSELEKMVENKKADLLEKKSFNDYLLKVAKNKKISDAAGSNYLLVSKKFGQNPYGDFGLSEWEEINPKTINSKAYLVLKKHGQPLHFSDLADKINEAGFDGRLAQKQTVHNELIKDPRFVLVGRGTYSLYEKKGK